MLHINKFQTMLWRMWNDHIRSMFISCAQSDATELNSHLSLSSFLSLRLLWLLISIESCLFWNPCIQQSNDPTIHMSSAHTLPCVFFMWSVFLLQFQLWFIYSHPNTWIRYNGRARFESYYGCVPWMRNHSCRLADTINALGSIDAQMCFSIKVRFDSLALFLSTSPLLFLSSFSRSLFLFFSSSLPLCSSFSLFLFSSRSSTRMLPMKSWMKMICPRLAAIFEVYASFCFCTHMQDI